MRLELGDAQAYKPYIRARLWGQGTCSGGRPPTAARMAARSLGAARMVARGMGARGRTRGRTLGGRRATLGRAVRPGGPFSPGRGGIFRCPRTGTSM